jgi:hypothetical protein
LFNAQKRSWQKFEKEKEKEKENEKQKEKEKQRAKEKKEVTKLKMAKFFLTSRLLGFHLIIA